MKTIEIIPSKSDAHRAYIAAALSEIQGDKPCDIICDGTSEDIEATKACLSAIKSNDGEAGADLYCGESGSTLRFLLPIIGALGIRGIFHPQGRLSQRPLSPLYEELCLHGMNISTPGSIPLIAEGKLASGEYRIPGNISSQFISGLLFALPLISGDSLIKVEGKLESAPYVDMTINTLKKFGIEIEEHIIEEEVPHDNSGNGRESEEKEDVTREYVIKGNQKYRSPKEYIVEGDWSNAAFWLAMGAIGKEPLLIKGLSLNSLQGDKKIIDVLKEFGVDIKIYSEDGHDYVEVHPSLEKMEGITYDAGETPDMVPVISLIGALSKGVTRIENAERLRTKESDRLHSVDIILRALGIDIDELPDGLIIHGGTLKPAIVESYNDHRLAMMAAAASTCFNENEKLSLIGWQAANKSYPTFFDKMRELKLDGNLELV